jgi:glycosyltransferase involved in cell wall biosynthesis
VRSGIADYAADMLPHVDGLADVRVLTLPGETPAARLGDRFRLAPLEKAPDEERLRLYHMGNNPYHLEVARAARGVPGILLLHDYVLHHLLLDRTVGRGDLEAYERELTADHGWIGHAAAGAARWNVIHESTLFALPAHRQLLRSQRGVVVHSEWAAERLREEDPELDVEMVPMGVPLSPPIDPAAGKRLRAELGIPETAPLLGSFGFQTHIKRTTSAVAALRRPGLETSHLLIVGQEDTYADLDGAVHRAGVHARVHRLGYVSFARLQEAIAAADVCLNLRYPTAGETSASLLRILAAGQPSVVSDHGPMRELPDDVVIKVEPGEHEVDALAGALRELLGQSERLAEMGRRAREHVAARHDPERSAALLVAACARLGSLVPPGPDRPQPPPISTCLATELAASFDVRGLEGVGPGERGPIEIRLENRGESRWLAAERGPGGVLVQIRLWPRDGAERCEEKWLGLPRDVAPGEACCLETPLRRPPGPARLEIELFLADSGLQRPAVWRRSLE